MKASELVGKHTIRTAPAILSVEGKLMDSSYMDSEHPVLITKYNADGKYFVINNEYGESVILGKEYDDDNWSEVHCSNTDDIPADASTFTISLEIPGRSDKQHNSEVKMNFTEVHDGEPSDAKLIDKMIIENGSVVIEYSCANVEPSAVKFGLVSNSGTYPIISIERCDDKPDMVFRNCPIFTRNINEIIEYGITRIRSLVELDHIGHIGSTGASASLGYQSVNLVLEDMIAGGYSTYDMVLMGAVSIYIATINANSKSIKVQWLPCIDLCDLDEQFPEGYVIALLTAEEEDDLNDKMYFKGKDCMYAWDSLSLG